VESTNGTVPVSDTEGLRQARRQHFWPGGAEGGQPTFPGGQPGKIFASSDYRLVVNFA